MNANDEMDDIFYEDTTPSEASIVRVKKAKIFTLVKVFPKHIPKLLIYKCKRGIRIIYKAKANRKTPARWKLCHHRPESVEDAFRVLCTKCKDRVKETYLKSHHDRTETTTDDYEEDARPRNDGLDTIYKADFKQYRRDKRSQYPGDYLSDFVWWYNEGYKAAVREASARVPSWCLGT